MRRLLLLMLLAGCAERQGTAQVLVLSDSTAANGHSYRRYAIQTTDEDWLYYVIDLVDWPQSRSLSTPGPGGTWSRSTTPPKSEEIEEELSVDADEIDVPDGMGQIESGPDNMTNDDAAASDGDAVDAGDAGGDAGGGGGGE